MPAWDSESAREAAKKSAEVRRRNKDMTPAERVQKKAAQKSDVIMDDLIKAAMGEPPFHELALEKRTDLMKTVLAYGVGRPTTSKANTQDPDDQEEPPEDAPLV